MQFHFIVSYHGSIRKKWKNVQPQHQCEIPSQVTLTWGVVCPMSVPSGSMRGSTVFPDKLKQVRVTLHSVHNGTMNTAVYKTVWYILCIILYSVWRYNKKKKYLDLIRDSYNSIIVRRHLTPASFKERVLGKRRVLKEASILKQWQAERAYSLTVRGWEGL